MSQQKTKGASSRRDFLKLAGTAAPAAVAAAAMGGTQAEAAEQPVNETRLQDTEHTRAYLDSARF
jgi:nitrous oxide reductase